ncbi:MAG: hypothetical protein H6519_01530 [Microthrixaceae bacterium]|nr:hypothetical protein [Acidimicrobiales bacterium]MCB9403095.1 hypothetical protein [Microthrixaceae bacterium]
MTDTQVVAGADRVMDAVGILTEEYRRDPDPELARQIVRLRHDAFGRDRAPSQRESWPPELADPFPDVRGVPEISAAEISAAVVGGAILHHGAVIVRGLLTPDEVSVVQDRALSVLEDRDNESDDGRPGAESAYRPFQVEAASVPTERAWVREVGGMLVADAPEMMLEVLEIFRAKGVIDTVTEYLGERPALSYNKCVLRRIRESAPTWHQDGAFIGSGIRAIDLWLSLSHCGGDNPAPGLDVVPKRVDEILETGTKGSIFPNSIGQGLVDEVAVDAQPETPSFAPGDAIFFDDFFVHRSSSEREFTADRYALESWFFAPSCFPERYVPILV